MTSNGEIGTVGEKFDIKEGDRVYAILGSDTPFILRRLGEENCLGGKYQGPKRKLEQGFLSSDKGKVPTSQDPEPFRPHKLIGPCYVYTMTNGETTAP